MRISIGTNISILPHSRKEWDQSDVRRANHYLYLVHCWGDLEIVNGTSSGLWQSVVNGIPYLSTLVPNLLSCTYFSLWRRHFCFCQTIRIYAHWKKFFGTQSRKFLTEGSARDVQDLSHEKILQFCNVRTPSAKAARHGFSNALGSIFSIHFYSSISTIPEYNWIIQNRMRMNSHWKTWWMRKRRF